MWPNPQKTVDLVTFTKEILNEKLHFLCSASSVFFFVNFLFYIAFINSLLTTTTAALLKLQTLCYIVSRRLQSFHLQLDHRMVSLSKPFISLGHHIYQAFCFFDLFLQNFVNCCWQCDSTWHIADMIYCDNYALIVVWVFCAVVYSLDLRIWPKLIWPHLAVLENYGYSRDTNTFQSNFQKSQSVNFSYLKPCQTSMMQLF